jgi:hypothetical protein
MFYVLYPFVTYLLTLPRTHTEFHGEIHRHTDTQTAR